MTKKIRYCEFRFIFFNFISCIIRFASNNAHQLNKIYKL